MHQRTDIFSGLFFSHFHHFEVSYHYLVKMFILYFAQLDHPGSTLTGFYRGGKVANSCLFPIWIHIRKQYNVTQFLVGSNNLDQIKINAHEVRALSSSLEWSNRVLLDKGVRDGVWSFENLIC